MIEQSGIRKWMSVISKCKTIFCLNYQYNIEIIPCCMPNLFWSRPVFGLWCRLGFHSPRLETGFPFVAVRCLSAESDDPAPAADLLHVIAVSLLVSTNSHIHILTLKYINNWCEPTTRSRKNTHLADMISQGLSLHVLLIYKVEVCKVLVFNWAEKTAIQNRETFKSLQLKLNCLPQVLSLCESDTVSVCW